MTILVNVSQMKKLSKRLLLGKENVMGWKKETDVDTLHELALSIF